MKRLIECLLRDESGQDLIEYSLLAGLIALVAVGAVMAVGTSLENWWTVLADNLPGSPP